MDIIKPFRVMRLPHIAGVATIVGFTTANALPAGGPSFAHIAYGSNGMANQGAAFVVGRL